MRNISKWVVGDMYLVSEHSLDGSGWKRLVHFTDVAL